MLKNHSTNCEALVEIMNPMVAKNTKHHDTVKNTSAIFKWGIESGKAMKRICDSMCFEQEWNLFDDYYA